MDRALQQRTYQRAADIADLLLSRGFPVVGFADLDGGHAIGIAFQLQDEPAKYATRLPLADASPERFAQLYEAVK